MSEPRRWWVLAEHHQTSLLSESKPDAPEECLFRVIEAEPVEKRIKDLEAQLAEAEEILMFYGQGGHPNMDMWEHRELGYFTGKRARQYLEKWGVK